MRFFFFEPSHIWSEIQSNDFFSSSFSFVCNLFNTKVVSLLWVQGETILKKLAEVSGKLSVRIAVNRPQEGRPQDDLRLLNDSGDPLL